MLSLCREGKRFPARCDMIVGRPVFRSFDEAKSYELARRETLCRAWKARLPLPHAVRPQKPHNPEHPEWQPPLSLVANRYSFARDGWAFVINCLYYVVSTCPFSVLKGSLFA